MNDVHCSFCRKGAKQVRRLVAGAGVYICNECVGLCVEIMEALGGSWRDPLPPAPQFNSPMEELFWQTCQGNPLFEQMTLQEQIGSYRVDFAFPDIKLAIEIDGFDYHSSRDDIVKDRKRQREIERGGWQFIRFAGSEIHRDPQRCVAEVVERVLQMASVLDSDPEEAALAFLKTQLGARPPETT